MADTGTTQILLVEDSLADVELTLEALEGATFVNEVHTARDGAAAIEYLHRRGEHAGASRPDLIILDLNLPRRSGHEVLADLKSDPELRRIPVVVLTTSDAEEDVLGSYDLHANAYVRKPVDFEQFVAAVRAIDDFFITVVRLPTKAP